MNVGEIKARILTMLNDDSIEANNYADESIELAERQIFNAVSGLNCFKSSVDAIALLSQDNGLSSITAADSLQALEIIRSVSVRETGDEQYYPLEKRTDDVVEYFSNGSGDPRFYRIAERTDAKLDIQIAPLQADTDYQLQIRGFGLHDKLDVSQTSSKNWLTEHAHDAMVYGAAWHLAIFLKKPGEQYMQNFELAVASLARKEGLQTMTEADAGITQMTGGEA